MRRSTQLIETVFSFSALAVHPGFALIFNLSGRLIQWVSHICNSSLMLPHGFTLLVERRLFRALDSQAAGFRC